jgi:hypothetical protein
MKRAWLCVPLLAATLFAQSGNKLESDLLSLNGAPTAAVNQQLVNDILSLAETNPQPSRRVVLDFVDELTRALAGKKLAAENLSQLAVAILDVLHSDSVTTSKYGAMMERARQTLIAMGVAAPVAQRVVNRLMILGQQVRGPEDLPVASPKIAAPK